MWTWPVTTEIEKINLKFISLVKNYPFIWNRKAPDYNNKRKRDKAWNEISEEVGDSAKQCHIHWTHIRRAYVNSLNPLNQATPYYLASALEFVRPHIRQGGLYRKESSGKEDNAADDSRSSMADIDIKSEPDDFDSATAPTTELDEQSLFDIIKMEDDAEDLHESEKASSTTTFNILKREDIDSNQIDNTKRAKDADKNLCSTSTCNKRKREDNDSNSNQINKTKGAKDGDKDLNPSSSLIEANRKFFESLIPFIDDMNKQQNLRFRREMMCLIDDVLDDRDINGGANNSS